MEFKPLTLEAIEFKDVPTEEELMTALRSMETFVTQMTGALLLARKYPAFDPQQKIGRMLGISVNIKQTIDAFQGTSQIAVPQPIIARPQ